MLCADMPAAIEESKVNCRNDRHLCDACLEKEYEAYRHARVHESMDRNEQWMEQFKIGDWPRWDRDFDSSTLIFSEEGQPRVIADIVVTGTVHGNEWEWAWGNPHLPAKSRDQMSAVRDFGEDKGWPKLTTLFLENDEYLGWELTAIAAHLLEAEGVYRCPDGDISGGFVYVLAFNTRFVNP